MKTQNESLQQQLTQTQKQLEGERDNLEWQIRVHCEEKQSLREQLEQAQSEAQNETSDGDLSAKAGEIAAYIKSLLADTGLLNTTLNNTKKNKPIQLPKEAISKIERILGGEDG